MKKTVKLIKPRSCNFRRIQAVPLRQKDLKSAQMLSAAMYGEVGLGDSPAFNLPFPTPSPESELSWVHGVPMPSPKMTADSYKEVDLYALFR